MGSKDDQPGESDQQAHSADAHEVASLIHTALYVTGGRSEEGAFVDHWVSNALEAVEALRAIFKRRGFWKPDRELVRQAVLQPGAPVEAAAKLLALLERWTWPLIEQLLRDPAPHVRVVAVRAVGHQRPPPFGQLLPSETWLPLLADQDLAVRAAAVTTLIEQWREVPDFQARRLQALDDEAPAVRLVAARSIGCSQRPEGAQILARRVEREPDHATRRELIVIIAQLLRSAGTDTQALTERPGEQVKALLLRELHHEDPQVRQAVAVALDRLVGEDIASAVLERLLVEKHVEVRAALAAYRSYRLIAERALPVLAGLFRSDPALLVQARAADSLATLGAPALPVLIAALDDPDRRMRAVECLDRLCNVHALPALLRALPQTADPVWRQRIEAVLSHIARVHGYYETPRPTPELAARIQAYIDELEPQQLGAWPVRVCQEQLNALPVRSSAIFLWAIQPTGEVLVMDHEAFGHPAELETDGLAAFAAVLEGALRYPELLDVLPQPPQGIELCHSCAGTGRAGRGPDAVGCPACSSLGWLVRPPVRSSSR